MTIKDQPHTYYVTTLMKAVDSSPQMRAAALGSAVDFFIKDAFIRKLFTNKLDLLPQLKESVEEKDPIKKDLIYKEAFPFAKEYMMSPLIRENKITDVEIWDVFELNGLYIRVKLDSACVNKGIIVPLDLKCKGLNSSASPTPKYKVLIDSGVMKTPHKDYSPDLEMKDISEKYAIQTCIYGWKLGLWGKEFYPVIHEISVTATKKTRLSLIEGKITVEYQEKLFSDMKDTWDSLRDGRFYFERLRTRDLNLAYYYSLKENWF